MTLIVEWPLSKIVVPAIRFTYWIYRKSGLSDFWTATIFILMSVALTAFLIVSTSLTGIAFWALVAFVFFGQVFVWIYIWRLRVIGIISADSEAKGGVDYEASLKMITHSLDFLGTGASKLTSCDNEFTQAVTRVVQHKGKVRLLLCGSKLLMEHHEKVANVSSGDYITKMKQSWLFLTNLKKRFGSALEIRLYYEEASDQPPPLRLMFINNELCLMSPVVVGAKEQGKSLWQLHVRGKSELWDALQSQFERAWESANEANVEESSNNGSHLY